MSTTNEIYMSASILVSGGEVRETGFIGDIISAVGSVTDVIGGGPQARAREAAANARAAEANAQVALAQAQTGAAGGGGGILAHKTLGIPTVALIAAAAGAAYFLMRRK